MKYSLIVISILYCFTLSAQDEVKRNIYYGNIAYHNESFDEAMTYYEKAIIESPYNYNANYDMANAYFKLEIYDKAKEKYESLLNQTNDIAKKSMLHHNIGNCNLSNQKLDDAIESYKKSLRLMPNAEFTRYNLAFALELKKEQEKQQQEQQEEQQDKQEGDSSENNSDNNQNKSDSEGENNNQNGEEQDSPENEIEKPEEEGNKTDSEEENEAEEKEDNSNNDRQQKDETNKVSESRKNALKILEEANKREKEVQEMMMSNKGKKNSNKKNTSSTKKDW